MRRTVLSTRARNAPQRCLRRCLRSADLHYYDAHPEEIDLALDENNQGYAYSQHARELTGGAWTSIIHGVVPALVWVNRWEQSRRWERLCFIRARGGEPSAALLDYNRRSSMINDSLDEL